MVTVREQIGLTVPADRVFDFIDAPAHQVTITPSLSEFTLLERLPNGGTRARYTYHIFGLSCSGTVRATDYVPNERIVWTVTGDLKGTLRWYLEPTHEGCRVTYAATYQIPGPSLIRPLSRPLLQHYHEREVRTLLHNLQAQLES